MKHKRIKSNTPKLTVIVPMYNEEATILDTITKIRDALQSLKNTWEILIVNDGSTDRTLEIADQLTKDDQRVKVVSHPNNIGRGAALRTGFKHAKGELIITAIV